jgi:hypothetical protein
VDVIGGCLVPFQRGEFTCEAVSRVSVKGTRVEPVFVVGRVGTGWRTTMVDGTFVLEENESAWRIGRAKV